MSARPFLIRIFVCASLSAAPTVYAGQARVAVASNFLGPARALAADFQRETGHRIEFSAGSTGMLYTQIFNGAPFDAFLAANAAQPERLEQDGQGVSGTRFTYAVGQLALLASNREENMADGAALLRTHQGATLAVANPKTAPYGAAAMEVLRELKIETGRWKVIQGENISQAYQYVATGNAQFGFVAVAQLHEAGVTKGFWLVPQSYYSPLRQQAILLKKGAENAAAKQWLAYLRSDKVREKLKYQFGYLSGD